MKIELYAGNSEYPFVPVHCQVRKGKNQKVQTIRREVVADPSTTTRLTTNEKL